MGYLKGTVNRGPYLIDLKFGVNLEENKKGEVTTLRGG